MTPNSKAEEPRQEILAKVAEWYVGVANGEKPLAFTQKQIKEFNA